MCYALRPLHPTYSLTATKSKATAKTKAKPKAPPPSVTPAPAASVYRRTVTDEQETDFMADLLGGMDSIVPTKPAKKSLKRKPDPEPSDRSSSPPYRSNHDYAAADADWSSDGLLDDPTAAASEPEDLVTSPKKKARMDSSLIPAIEGLGKLGVQSGTESESYDDIDMDSFMDVDDDDLDSMKMPPKPKVALDAMAKPMKPSNGDAAKKKSDGPPSWLSVYDSLSVAKDDSLATLDTTTTTARTAAASSNYSLLEEDGSLRFYWLDYHEHDGVLDFFGKAQDKKTKEWVSLCVRVENLQRNLFVLPRERRVAYDEETEEIYETDAVPEMKDIYEDFDSIRKKAGIKSFRAKFVNRKYAFGEKDVPRGESQWLKVVYSFHGMHWFYIVLERYSNVPAAEPALPSDAASPNFYRIFGTNTSAFELLVLKRKIMGPCWLQIKQPQVENKGVRCRCTLRLSGFMLIFILSFRGVKRR